ncbi:MAG: STAS domain-containing protein [Candidatus Sulfotelmatobacter sp.]
MPQEPLQIEDVTSSVPGQRIVRLVGPILISNFFQFQTTVRTDESRSLILDLTKVPYVDSAGIGALVGAYVSRQKDGRNLALAGVSDRVRGSLQVTRVEQFFKFYDTVEAAQSACAA